MANSAIILWKPTGEIVFLNEFAQRFFGYSADEILGKHVSMLVPETDSCGQSLAALAEDVIGYPDEYVAHVNENLCKDGRRVWVSWTNRAIFDEEDRLAEILAVGNDVTAQKELEEALRKARDDLKCAVEERTEALLTINATLQQEIAERAATERALARKAEELARSNRDLEQFAYAASHDLQEPLRNVSSCMQLLRNRYSDQLGSDAAELMRYAEDSTERMKNLINGLLTYSRVKTRGNPFEPRHCERILQDTLDDLHQAIEESGAVVTHDALPKLLVDGTQLAQAFQNLIGNAIKFRGTDPPRVHVSAKRDQGEWIFSVADNGIGIDSEYTDRIFTVFKRLHSGSTYPGTGIGLSITKKIVERHGGRIWVESVPRVGSTFFFTLPVNDDEGKRFGPTR